MISRSKDIVFLLGAGASAEAGIPTSAQMIDHIERLLVPGEEWESYRHLYHHVKSAIYYAAGLRGHFNKDVDYNIETLVNTLYELEKNEDHPLYPFIATWNSRFAALAQTDFRYVREFRREILRRLKKWMCPENTSEGDYYRGLAKLQQALNFPLRVFSLNYDLCVERLKDPDFTIETGFEGYGNRYNWDWERFEESGAKLLPELLLYKLHGSINWKRRGETKQLFCVEQVESIEADEMEVIFGRDFKLDAADPYLFYAYEFRRYVLAAKLVVAVGYGFGDAHINKMLAQCLRHDAERSVLVVNRCKEDQVDGRAGEIRVRLEVEEARSKQVCVLPDTAKEFLEKGELAELLGEHVPEETGNPF